MCSVRVMALMSRYGINQVADGQNTKDVPDTGGVGCVIVFDIIPEGNA